MIDLEIWQNRYDRYKTLDYANNFYDFWRWKVKVEKNNINHILDYDHLSKTHDKLIPIMKAWQTYRPYDSDICLQYLKTSLVEIAPVYNKIRHHSLLDLESLPVEDLKYIWHKLGRAKELGGKEHSSTKYYAVAVTKPLMFLWGQTLAFDNLVRTRMPDFNNKGTANIRWTFYLWLIIMKKFRDKIVQNQDFIDLVRETAKKAFGSEKYIPYGQFIDLYYWVGDR